MYSTVFWCLLVTLLAFLALLHNLCYPLQKTTKTVCGITGSPHNLCE